MARLRGLIRTSTAVVLSFGLMLMCVSNGSISHAATMAFGTVVSSDRGHVGTAAATVGTTVLSGDDVAPEVGNALQMKFIPLGTNVHNIEMQPGQGGKLVRSAGASAQLTNKEEKYAVLKMPSGELRKVLINCYATVGVVSNSDHSLQSMGKAGRNRWRGIRPRNRGVAMNPVDHPMGGGEGRASGGHPRSRKGKYAKGQITRTKGKGSSKLIITRRNGKKLPN